MKKINFKNIKVKLLFWYGLVIFLLLFFFSSVLMYLFTQQNIHTVDSSLKTVIHNLDHEVDEILERPSKIFNEHEEFRIKNLYLKIYEYKNEKFEVFVDTDKQFKSENLKVLQKDSWQTFTIGNDLINQIRVVRYHLEFEGRLIYIESATTLYDKIYTPIDNLEDTLAILVPIIFFISILMGYLIVNSSLKTVKRVIDEVKEISADGLDKRINNPKSGDEIEELIDTFNKMLGKIEESVDKIKRFSNDVSHELKTPLTVIRGELELGLRKERTEDEYKDILKSSLDETKQLQNLIDNLLFLSTSNKDEIQSRFEKASLDEILFDVVLETQYLAKKKNIHVLCEEIDEVTDIGNILLLKILIGNILKNAIKYSNNDTSIIIRLNKERLSIRDAGIGIKEEELKYIFDRFYRVDSSRGRGGHGLGLSIVKSISELHGYELSVDSKYGEFTEFVVNFNLKD